MSEFTPSELDFIDTYVSAMSGGCTPNEDHERAKEARRGIVKVKADALREAVESARVVIDIGSESDSAYHHGARYGQHRFADWLGVRADRIESGAEK